MKNTNKKTWHKIKDALKVATVLTGLTATGLAGLVNINDINRERFNDRLNRQISYELPLSRDGGERIVEVGPSPAESSFSYALRKQISYNLPLNREYD